jgi:hypothetical protein
VTRRATLILVVLWLIAAGSMVTVAAVAKAHGTPRPSPSWMECPPSQGYEQACYGP